MGHSPHGFDENQPSCRHVRVFKRVQPKGNKISPTSDQIKGSFLILYQFNEKNKKLDREEKIYFMLNNVVDCGETENSL